MDLSLWSSNFSYGCLPQRTENKVSKRYLYTCVHSSSIHSSWKTEASQKFILKRMDKHYTDNEILLSLKKELREGNGTPLQYSCLEHPMDGGAWWAAVHGVTKSRAWLSDFTFTFHFHALRMKWQPTPVFLPGESQGQRSLVGRHLWGHRVRHDWNDLAAVAAARRN